MFYLNSEPKCVVEAAPENAQLLTKVSEIGRGLVADYQCNSGFVDVAGDAVRACGTDGKLKGAPLKCIKGWKIS